MRKDVCLRRKELLFGLFIFLVAVIYEVMALRMPRGHITYPGPGFYPSVVGVFLLLTSGSFVLWMLLAGKKTTASPAAVESTNQTKKSQRGKTLLLISLLLFYVITVNSLGFLLAISLFIILSIRLFGYRRWLPSLGITIAVAGISYLSFVVWLKVPLPQGILGGFLEGILG